MITAIWGILLNGCNKDPDIEGEKYTGSAAGYGGNVSVDITITKDGKINAVKIDAPEEAPNIGGMAAPQIAEQIIKSQSLDIDIVSGATITSTAIINATESALNDGGLDINTFINK